MRNVPPDYVKLDAEFVDNHHGYVRCQVTPDLWQTDYRVVTSVIQPDDGGISTLATFPVEQGEAGAVQA